MLNQNIIYYHEGYIEKDDKIIYDVFDTYSGCLNRIKRSLKKRVRNGTLNPDDIILVHIQDASGYFRSCPEIFGGYCHKQGKVSEFI